MSKAELAERLKVARRKSGLTIYEVGEKVGKSGKTVSAWECGRAQPDADMLLTLCTMYGVRIADIYGEKDDWTDEEKKLIDAYRRLTAEGKSLAEKYVGYLEGDFDYCPQPVRKTRKKRQTPI